MNLMIQPNQICLIVKLYNNRPELLPDSNVSIMNMEENYLVLQMTAQRTRIPKVPKVIK